VLAAAMVVVGFGSAVANQRKERPSAEESPAGMSVVERAKRAVQPTWYAFVLPFLGAAGAAAGGLCRGRGAAEAV
jgi:hypothetical protein